MDDWEMDESGRQQLSELILAFQDIFAQNLEVQKELSMRSTLGSRTYQAVSMLRALCLATKNGRDDTENPEPGSHSALT